MNAEYDDDVEPVRPGFVPNRRTQSANSFSLSSFFLFVSAAGLLMAVATIVPCLGVWILIVGTGPAIWAGVVIRRRHQLGYQNDAVDWFEIFSGSLFFAFAFGIALALSILLMVWMLSLVFFLPGDALIWLSNGANVMGAGFIGVRIAMQSWRHNTDPRNF